MKKGESKNESERLIGKKNLNPEKYGMVACSVCKSIGYVQNPERQCCPNCRGFGFIRKENKSPNSEG
jgi:uncharacterized OB-fold protein